MHKIIHTVPVRNPKLKMCNTDFESVYRHDYYFTGFHLSTKDYKVPLSLNNKDLLIQLLILFNVKQLKCHVIIKKNYKYNNYYSFNLINIKNFSFLKHLKNHKNSQKKKLPLIHFNIKYYYLI